MNNQPNQEELNGVIERINRLGAASERVFSRLYKGLSGHEGDTQQIREQNRQLQTTLKNRNIEIERLNSILASIDQGVIMQDNEGRLVLVNEAARKLLGNIKAFWQSELGTLFNNYRTFAPIDAELSPLTAPTPRSGQQPHPRRAACRRRRRSGQPHRNDHRPARCDQRSPLGSA